MTDTTLTDLAEHLAALHAADCESMGAAWAPRDAHEGFEAGDLAGWLRDRGLPADEDGVGALRRALAVALAELRAASLPADAGEALDAVFGDDDDDDVLDDAAKRGAAAVLDEALRAWVKHGGGRPAPEALRRAMLARLEDRLEERRDSALRAAIAYLGAEDLPGGQWRYYADEVSTWFAVDEAQLVDLGERLARGDKDAYSFWCGETSAEELP